MHILGRKHIDTNKLMAHTCPNTPALVLLAPKGVDVCPKAGCDCPKGAAVEVPNGLELADPNPASYNRQNSSSNQHPPSIHIDQKMMPTCTKSKTHTNIPFICYLISFGTFNDFFQLLVLRNPEWKPI